MVDQVLTRQFPLIPSEEQGPFVSLRQGPATNEFAKIKAVEGRNVRYDEISNCGIIEHPDGYTVSINNYDSIAKLGDPTHVLLDALLVELTKSGVKDGNVLLSLDTYMEMRGVKDKNLLDSK